MKVLLATEPIEELGILPGDRIYFYNEDARIVRRIKANDVEPIRDRMRDVTTPEGEAFSALLETLHPTSKGVSDASV